MKLDVAEVAEALGWPEYWVRVAMRLPLTALEKVEARRYMDLARRVSREEPDCPVGVLHAAADALGWQEIRVLRAAKGKRSP